MVWNHIYQSVDVNVGIGTFKRHLKSHLLSIISWIIIFSTVCVFPLYVFRIYWSTRHDLITGAPYALFFSTLTLAPWIEYVYQLWGHINIIVSAPFVTVSVLCCICSVSVYLRDRSSYCEISQDLEAASFHYNDVIMDAIASQITSLTIVYSTVYSGADQRKHQSSASLAFVRGIHRWPVNSPHKWPVTRKMFPFDDVIMCFQNCVTGRKIDLVPRQQCCRSTCQISKPFNNLNYQSRGFEHEIYYKTSYRILNQGPELVRLYT